MCHGKPFKRKNQQTAVGWGVGVWGNSSSKAFGIGFDDRPKAKTGGNKEQRKTEYMHNSEQTIKVKYWSPHQATLHNRD
jgi:hypothetical protein